MVSNVHIIQKVSVKEGKKSWTCLEKFHFCAPEYYRAGTRMAAQQQQKSYNRPLHFFPYKIAILLSPESAHIESIYHSFITLFHVKRVHRGIRQILTMYFNAQYRPRPHCLGMIY